MMMCECAIVRAVAYSIQYLSSTFDHSLGGECSKLDATGCGRIINTFFLVAAEGSRSAAENNQTVSDNEMIPPPPPRSSLVNRRQAWDQTKISSIQTRTKDIYVNVRKQRFITSQEATGASQN